MTKKPTIILVNVASDIGSWLSFAYHPPGDSNTTTASGGSVITRLW